MSIFTLIKGKKVSLDTFDMLYGVLNYITRASAANMYYIYGAGVSTINAYAEMKAVKCVYGQTNGKGFIHYVLSPEPSECISANNLFIAGIHITNYISHYCGYFQALMAIHFDKAPHFHLHIVENNIDLYTGERLNIDRKRLAFLKQELSKILVSNGISPIRQNSVVDETGAWKNLKF